MRNHAIGVGMDQQPLRQAAGNVQRDHVAQPFVRRADHRRQVAQHGHRHRRLPFDQVEHGVPAEIANPDIVRGDKRRRPRLAVAATTATLDGTDLGPAGPLRVQDHLEEFWLPRRGLFYAGSVAFEPYDATRHRLVATRADLETLPE